MLKKKKFSPECNNSTFNENVIPQFCTTVLFDLECEEAMVVATVCAVNFFFPVLISSHEYSSAIQYRAKFASTMMKRHNSSSLVLLQWASKERRTRVSEASSLVSSLELAKSRGWISRIGALEEDDQGAVSTTSSTGTEEEEEEEEASSTSAIKPPPLISEKRARGKKVSYSQTLHLSILAMAK